MNDLKVKRNLKTHKSNRYIGTLPNTIDGRRVAANLSVLYRPWGRVVKMGRHPKRMGMMLCIGYLTNTIRSFVPQDMSTYFDLYLRPKNEGQRGLTGIPEWYNLPLGVLEGMRILRTK